MSLLHISDLDGRSIVKWIATEMALSEATCGQGTVLWSDSSAPYLQLTGIDIHFDDGAVWRMLSQLDDGSENECFGLYMLVQEAIEPQGSFDMGSIYRTRELTELPVGPATVTVLETEGSIAVVRMAVSIDGRTVSFWAAEVYARVDGSFDIAGSDGSILVQVDGRMPLVKSIHQLPIVRAAAGRIGVTPQLPTQLINTVALIGRAYADDIPENEYTAVLKILYDHMCDRNLAHVMSYVTGRDYAFTYNDVLGIPSREIETEILQRVTNKFVRVGLHAWIDAG